MTLPIHLALPFLPILAQATESSPSNAPANPALAAGVLLMVCIVGGAFLLISAAIGTLILQTAIEFVTGEAVSFGSALLTVFLLFLVSIGLGAAEYFYYSAQIVAHGGDFQIFSHLASHEELLKFRKALEASVDPISGWVLMGISIVAGGFVVSMRHNSSLIQGIVIQLASGVIYWLIVAGGVLAVFGGAKAHMVLAP